MPSCPKPATRRARRRRSRAGVLPRGHFDYAGSPPSTAPAAPPFGAPAQGQAEAQGQAQDQARARVRARVRARIRARVGVRHGRRFRVAAGAASGRLPGPACWRTGLRLGERSLLLHGARVLPLRGGDRLGGAEGARVALAVLAVIPRLRALAELAAPGWSKAVESAALEVAGSSTRGSGWAPSGHSLGAPTPLRAVRCALRRHRRRAWAVPRLQFVHAAARLVPVVAWQRRVAKLSLHLHRRSDGRLARSERAARQQGGREQRSLHGAVEWMPAAGWSGSKEADVLCAVFFSSLNSCIMVRHTQPWSAAHTSL